MLLVCLAIGAKAQSFTLKTNLAGWAAQAANIGGGFVFDEHSSVDMSIYKTLGQSWLRDADFYGLQIEYRYWMAEQPLEDFFAGVSVMPVKFDNLRVNTKNPNTKNVDGSFVSGSLNFGYCWMLSARFSLDIEYGVGMTYIYYQDKSQPDKWTGKQVWHEHETIRFMPANFGINLSYIIR